MCFRRKFKCSSVIVFILLFLLFFCCTTKKEEEQLFLRLEKDLEIGIEGGDENYMFAGIIDVEVDSKGNIYVLDWRNRTVKKYDKNGSFLQNIGQAGQGPGEFSAILVDSFVDKSDKLYVVELRKVHVFSEDGKFIRTFIPDFFPRGILVDQEDRIILVGEMEEKIFHTYDQSGRYAESFGELFFVPETIREFYNNKKTTDTGIYHISEDANLYVFHPCKYEIDVYKEKELLRKISRNGPHYESPRKSKNDKGEDVLLSTWAKILDSEKYLFVWYGKEVEDYVLDDVRHIDIFDKKDYSLLNTVQITEKGRPNALKNNKMYFCNNDEGTDFPKVIRYTISLF